MYRNFDFARTFAPMVAEGLDLADNYLYSVGDSHGCMLKVGAAIEDLVHQIIAIEDLDLPLDVGRSLQGCIIFLKNKRSCPERIIQDMEYIRRKRNKANHESWRKEHDARVCLKRAHRILSWCVEHYQIGTPTQYEPLDGTEILREKFAWV